MSDVPTWMLTVLAVLLVLGWYLSYSAARLDRLHHQVETLRAALDAQLARRAAAAVEAAPLLDPATGLLVADAAPGALAAGGTRGGAGGLRGGGAPRGGREGTAPGAR